MLQKNNLMKKQKSLKKSLNNKGRFEVARNDSVKTKGTRELDNL